MLAWTIYLSFAGALVLALLPKGKNALARWLALAVAVAGLAVAVAGFAAGMGQGRTVLVEYANGYGAEFPGRLQRWLSRGRECRPHQGWDHYK